MLDTDRGVLNFYKDGQDLGPAFVDVALTNGEFFPFLRVKQKLKLEVFSPKQYEWYEKVPIEPVCPEEPAREEEFFYSEIADEERRRLEREEGYDRPSLYGIDLGDNSMDMSEAPTEIVGEADVSRFLHEDEDPDETFEARYLDICREEFEKKFEMRDSNRFDLELTRGNIDAPRDSEVPRHRRSIRIKHTDLHLDAYAKHVRRNVKRDAD
jgi:hypothetical protein